jgi:hypothetical protein
MVSYVYRPLEGVKNSNIIHLKAKASLKGNSNYPSPSEMCFFPYYKFKLF